MCQDIRCSHSIRTLHLLMIIFLVATLVLTAPPRPAYAATRNVDINNPLCNDGTGSPAYCHIQPAIDAAVNGDTISIAAGTYVENLGFYVVKDLTLVGAGAGATIIDGNQAGPVINLWEGSVVISGITIRNGNFANGGGIFNQRKLTLLDSIVSGNTSDYGAGILNSFSFSNLTLINSTVSDNISQTDGGGIANDGTLTLTNSIISSNTANNSGGGIKNSGSITLTNSIISGNSAAFQGGGILNWGPALMLTNSTISGNSAQYGGGIATATSTILRNTLLAGNVSPSDPDCGGPLPSQGYNLIGNSSGCDFTPATGDQVGTAATPIDPRLGALRDNGGATWTQAPLAGSPALDAIPNGVNGCGTTITTDQRGVARPQGGRCDIGAYEANGVPMRLVFAVQPAGGPEKGQFATQPIVGVEDSAGNGASFSGTVNLVLKGAMATLSGTRTVMATGGMAKFTNLALDKAGTGYQLQATSAGLLPAVSAVFSVTSDFRLSIQHEQNDTIERATPLGFDSSGHAASTGMITSTSDVDIFSFTSRPGATVAISLTNMPADYDMLLLSDPRITIPLSDSIDLGNIADIGQHAIGQHAIGQHAIGQHAIGASAQDGTNPESIAEFLPLGGRYFIVVAGHEGAFDNTSQYRLDVALQDGALVPADVKATPVATLNLEPDPAVRTIYLYNSSRMASRYPEEAAAVRALTSTLQMNSPLMVASNGVAIDLSGPMLQSTDATTLTMLYDRWDAIPAQPLRANEVAQEIWYVLDRAITSYYTGTTDVVIVGSDEMIPFYRIPDETLLANESSYNPDRARQTGTALYGSLFYHFIQTDNFYADRRPTAWRGRALYLPDLGIGRLVERPSEILHYLNGYLASGNYTIDASKGALVTGYDFLTDQANAVAQQLNSYSRPSGESIKITRLISDTWDAKDLARLWFSGQLPQLTKEYSGAQTHYSIMSINSHFTHASAIPAKPAGGVFSAERILTPTIDQNNDAQAFFKIDGAPTLLYSVGCHSGLNVAASAFISSTLLQADFPEAIIKQGGNWIGNTGYGYGDTDVVGYSERLSLLFTAAIGRDVKSSGTYVGESIGTALARAKRQYLKTSAAGTFSVSDEKVITEWTLYGLPFIHVKVPRPVPMALADDPAPTPIPESIRTTLGQTGGVFTRLITMTNTYDQLDASSLVMVTSVVHDSFAEMPALTTTLTSMQQTALNRPVLPLLTYDITLQANSDAPAGSIPIPRGVRLRSATMLPDLAAFDPHVTTPVTDLTTVQQRTDPPLNIGGGWLPALPYTAQRTNYIAATRVVTADKLLVMPAQFNATTSTTGRLRRFSQMVFEVTYVDPSKAPAATLSTVIQPLFDDARATPITQANAAIQATAQPKVRLSAVVRDASGRSLREVSATYTIDDAHWQRVVLSSNGANSFAATVPAPLTGNNIYAFFEAIDKAGNITVETNKGTLAAFYMVYLPLVGR